MMVEVFENRRRLRQATAQLVCLWCLSAHAGYTHYFTWKQKPDEAALKKCIAEMGLILDARKQILEGSDGPGSAMAFALGVDFNGIGDDAHEPFVFPGKEGFNFCKTAAKPYDDTVTVCLIVARDHFPPSVLSIDSDGSWADWIDGVKLYVSVLHRPAHNPMRTAIWDYEPVCILIVVLAALVAGAVVWRKKRLRSH